MSGIDRRDITASTVFTNQKYPFFCDSHPSKSVNPPQQKIPANVPATFTKNERKYG
jgi:hypothetical protein